jgi:hypothetical protein
MLKWSSVARDAARSTVFHLDRKSRTETGRLPTPSEVGSFPTLGETLDKLAAERSKGEASPDSDRSE